MGLFFFCEKQLYKLLKSWYKTFENVKKENDYAAVCCNRR